MTVDLRFAPTSHSRWRSWWSNWAFSRLKPSDTHRLTLHNVYVLPTQAGWMMLVTIAVLLLATINYQLNLGYVLIFLLMGAGVIGLYVAHRAMTRITLHLDTSKALHGIAGEDVEVAIEVTASITNSGSRIQNLSTQFHAIGQQPLPLVTCETRYPLGLLRLWTVWRVASKAQIDAPKALSSVAPLSDDPAPVDPTRDDFRAYRVGDAPRDLLWKSVAKRPDSPASWGVREQGASAAKDAALATARYAASQRAPAASHDPQALQAMLKKRQQRDQLLLCVLLAISLPFFLHIQVWYPLMATALIGIRLWLTTRAASQAYKWLQLPLIAGLGALIWLQFKTFNGIEPSVSACLGLLGIKALELPSHQIGLPANTDSNIFSRDRWVLVFLGLFTLAAHFLVSQSLLSSVLVVLGLIGLIYVLVDAHSPALRASKLKTTVTLVLLGAPIMLVLFFLFPRFAPLWTLIPPKTSAVSGLSNEMRVGDISQISLDNRIMLRLSIDPPAKLTSKDIYLRGSVLPYFDGRTWRTYVKGQSNDKLPPSQLDWLGAEPLGYTVYEGGTTRRGTATYAARNNAQSTSYPYLEVARALPAQSNPRTSQWLQGLRQDSRYSAYTASDWSEHLLRTLQTGGFSYSLEPGAYGEHMVDELLFDRAAGNKLGFCEHYASVFVIAMRQLGIPARVVTGYQGAEVNPIDGLWVVRNRNAHAWAEYWGESGNGLGWQRVDPTAAVAPGRIQSLESFNQAPEQVAKQTGFGGLTANLQWLRAAGQTWDATSHAWEQWMQNYNQGTQLSLLKNLGFEAPSWKSMVQLLNAALVVLLLLGAASYALAGRRNADPWLLLLQAARNKALQAGLLLGPNASPQEIAQALPVNWPHRAAATLWLMQLEESRYRHHSKESRNSNHLATLKRSFKSLF